MIGKDIETILKEILGEMEESSRELTREDYEQVESGIKKLKDIDAVKRLDSLNLNLKSTLGFKSAVSAISQVPQIFVQDIKPRQYKCIKPEDYGFLADFLGTAKAKFSEACDNIISEIHKAVSTPESTKPKSLEDMSKEELVEFVRSKWQ